MDKKTPTKKQTNMQKTPTKAQNQTPTKTQPKKETTPQKTAQPKTVTPTKQVEKTTPTKTAQPKTATPTKAVEKTTPAKVAQTKAKVASPAQPSKKVETAPKVMTPTEDTPKKKSWKAPIKPRKIKEEAATPSAFESMMNKVQDEARKLYKTTPREVKIVGVSSLLIFLALFLQLYVFAPTQYQPITNNLSHDLLKWNKMIWAPFRTLVVDHLIDSCGWKVVNPVNATIVWVRSENEVPDYVDYEEFGNGRLLSNIPQAEILGNKGQLHTLLKESNLTQLQPTTYSMTDAYECAMFFKSLEKNPDLQGWIGKMPVGPVGRGVFPLPSIEKLRSDFLVDIEAKGDDIKCRTIPAEDELLITKVINPIKMQDTSIEYRSYWSILSVEPFIVLFHDGAAHKREWDIYEDRFSLEEIADNLKVQKKIDNTNTFITNIRNQLKQTVGEVAKAIHPKLLKNKKAGWDGRFDLFAMDTIIEENTLKPYLIEIQNKPQIASMSGMSNNFSEKMIEEFINVLLEADVRMRQEKKLSASNLISLKEWTLVEA